MSHIFQHAHRVFGTVQDKIKRISPKYSQKLYEHPVEIRFTLSWMVALIRWFEPLNVYNILGHSVHLVGGGGGRPTSTSFPARTPLLIRRTERDCDKRQHEDETAKFALKWVKLQRIVGVFKCCVPVALSGRRTREPLLCQIVTRNNRDESLRDPAWPRDDVAVCLHGLLMDKYVIRRDNRRWSETRASTPPYLGGFGWGEGKEAFCGPSNKFLERPSGDYRMKENF